MIKNTWLFVLCVMSALALSVTALAQNPHFVGQVRTTDLGNQLQVSGSVAGLGNQPIDVVVTAIGTATVQCINPAGNPAPGQRTTAVATAVSSTVETRNGRANFNVITPTPSVDPAEVCPNPQWTARVTDVRFTSVRIQVFQPAGSGMLVLSQMFTL